jgi:hypothetical protein
MALALHKEASFAECLLVHSAKELIKGPLVIPLSSASTVGTQQRWSLSRLPPEREIDLIISYNQF